MRTLVVNFFAGPGAGKTTCAWEVAAALKKAKIVTEYVPEYPKELVWDGNTGLLDGSYKNQRAVLAEQKRRLDRLIGKVDVIVTDSPLILQTAYVRKNKEQFERDALAAHNEYDNFNLFINRGKHYEQAGRIHSLTDSAKIDEEIKDILKRNSIFFGNYYHHTIGVVVENIKASLNRLQHAPPSAEAQAAVRKNNSEEMPKAKEAAIPLQEVSFTVDELRRVHEAMGKQLELNQDKAGLQAFQKLEATLDDFKRSQMAERQAIAAGTEQVYEETIIAKINIIER